jgi:hypothetical protein
MRWLSLAMIVCLAWGGRSMAQSPHARPTSWLNCFSTKVCPSIGCCPDDYCRKPMPCLYDVLPGCNGDDYCRKPMPCLYDVLRGCGGDDYCRKAMPCLLCPPLSPSLQCAPCEINVRGK